jgi:hypothetical protein
MDRWPVHVLVPLLVCACGGCAMPKMPEPPMQTGDSFTFTAILHSPGTLAGVPGDEWFVEPLPQDKKAGRKPMPVDVSAVLDRAKELDGRVVKISSKKPRTKAEAELAQRMVRVSSIEPE